MAIIKGKVDIENGETLFYRKKGEGNKLLLLIHGNMSSSKHWEPLMEKFPPAYTAYAVDMRGFGDSSYNKPIASLADLSEDIIMFARKLGLNKFIPVGWSTGGGVAMQMTAEQPEMVEKLILVESVSYKGYPIFRKDESGLPVVGEFYGSKEEMAGDPVQVAPVKDAIEKGNSEYIKYLWDQLIYVVNKPEQQAYEENIAATMKQRNLVDIDWALTSFNLSSTYNGVAEGNGLIDKINCPVLAFWGERDLVVTRDMAEDTVKAIGDNARLVILENCGHSSITDAPDKILQEIIEFVG